MLDSVGTPPTKGLLNPASVTMLRAESAYLFKLLSSVNTVPLVPPTLTVPLKVPLAPLISPANLAVPPTILNSSELISPLLLSIIPVLVYPSVPTVGTLEPVCIFVELIVQPPTRPASLISAFSCGTTSTSLVL